MRDLRLREYFDPVPEDWNIVPLLSVAKYTTGFTPPSKNKSFYGEDYVWVNISDLDGRRTISSSAKGLSQLAIDTYTNEKPAAKGSLLFSFKLSLGNVAIAEEDIFTNEAIAAFTPIRGLDMSFAFYMFPVYLPLFSQTNIYGAELLGGARFERAKIPLPSLEEQRRIVEYLDEETFEIDLMVSRLDELIEDLDQLERTTIENTLTQNLYAKPDKSSLEEIDVSEDKRFLRYFGNIPDHWKVMPLPLIASYTTGFTPPSKDERYYGGEYDWVNISDMGRNQTISSTKKKLSQFAVDTYPTKKPAPKGSLLFSFKLSIGQVAILEKDMYTNEAIAAFTPKKELDLRFAYFAFPVFLPVFSQTNIYGAELLGRDRFLKAKVPVPPLDEQRRIASFLETEAVRIENMRSTARELRGEILARRKALIKAYVTGKERVD